MQQSDSCVSKELVINSVSGEVEIALLESGQLVELHRDQGNKGYAVGDIFVGRVRKVLPSLNAAFVDVGHERDAFLHYLDLGPFYRTQQRYLKRVMQGKQPVPDMGNFTKDPEIDKKGKIKDEVSASQLVLVQVAKEPISSKGPRLTAEVTLPGRYIVLVPFSDKVSLSGRIKTEEERKRLKRLMQSIRPPGFGIIVRTVAENKGAADLHADLEDLVARWGELHKKLRNAKAGNRVLGELNKTNAVLRDVLTSDCTSIRVNDERLGDEVRTYLQSIGSSKSDIVRVSNDRDLFNTLSIHRQIKATFGKQVNLRSGAYLIVEQTEAMHVIDVNSGNRSNKGESQEDNALAVNMMAAEEIGRQLRLRDMGGIICIDFIDMHKGEHRKQLFEKMKEVMATDRARHKILPPSKFGLVEITRQRVRPAQRLETKEENPDSLVEAPITLIDALEQKFDQIVGKMRNKKDKSPIFLHVHPFIYAYLTKGFWWKARYRQWSKLYGHSLKMVERDAFKMLEYRFTDDQNRKLG